MDDVFKKFKTGANGELLLDQPRGAGFEKVLSAPAAIDGTFPAAVTARNLGGEVGISNGEGLMRQIFTPFLGVKSDGATDDTSAWMRVRDAAIAASAAGYAVQIIMGPGTTLISDTLDFNFGLLASFVPAGSTLTPPRLVGQGRNATRIKMTAGGKPAMRWWAPLTAASQLWGTYLEGFALYGPGDLTDTASCGIQFGGVDTTGSNILSSSCMRDVLISGFYSGTRHDDNTLFRFLGCYWENCRFGSELAYNCDCFEFDGCEWGSQSMPQDFAATTGTDTTITGIPLVTAARLKPGMMLIGANLAAGTRIVSVDSAAGSVVVSTVPSAAGATTLSAALMTAIVTGGKDGGVDVGGPWIPAFNVNRGNQNSITIRNFWAMRLERLLWAPNATVGNVAIHDGYNERGYAFALIGNSNSTSAPRPVTIARMHFSQPVTFRHVAPIQCAAGGGSAPHLTIEDCRTDASGAANLPKIQWVKTGSLSTGGRIRWARNSLGVDTGVVTTGLLDIPGFYSDGLTTGDAVAIGGAERGGYVPPVSLGGSFAKDWNGLDGLNVTLTGNATISNPGSVDAPNGRVLTLMFTQDATGGRSVTFGSRFVAVGGGALGTVTGGTAGQVGSITFVAMAGKYQALNSLNWS